MQFSNSYVQLGKDFYQSIDPTSVESPELFLWNKTLADQLSLNKEFQADKQSLAHYFSGDELLPGSEPIATAYAGHQFGNFVPQLGDGRAHLLGEVIDINGQRLDIQLKGSGRTEFSRGGDGRCALGPAIREYIMSESMAALGVPTSRCLAVVTTGEYVQRESVLPGAVVTRVASSHIRVGTFEYFAARRNYQALKTLLDFSINRHYPEINESPENPLVLFIKKVMARQIKLVVEWMRVGFIHGVMNTDNTAISGETIDFGPCAMMGSYNPQAVFSSIDHYGRYAFGNQPDIAKWNMGKLAQSLMLLVDKDDSETIERVQSLYDDFTPKFNQTHLKMMAGKFGLNSDVPEDVQLIHTILEHLNLHQLDYTVTFDRLTRALRSETEAELLKVELKDHYTHWQQRIKSQKGTLESIYQKMRHSNPLVIPRNHQIEAVLHTCQQSGSSDSAEKILSILRHPYEELAGTSLYQVPAEDRDKHYQTFCGT